MTMKRTMMLAILFVCGAAQAADVVCNFTLAVDKGYLKWTRATATSVSIASAAPNVAGGTQLIPTDAAGTALTLGSVLTNGWAWFGNMSTNNYVELGTQWDTTNFFPLLRLNAGEFAPVRLAVGVTPYARANGAAVVLERYIFDN
jgi:hypothetical protein